MNLRQAEVVRVNQARRTVDLVFLDTREPVRDVAVATGKASSDSGSWDVPDVPMPASSAQAGQVPATGRAMVALVGAIGRKQVVIGWMTPPTRQVAFTDPNREVDRHPSGVVTSTDQFGNIQVQHPGGVTIRIGSPQIEDIGKLAADGNWSIPTGTPPTITVVTPKATLVIEPATGNVTLVSQGDVSIQAKDAIVTTSGDSTVSASGNVAVTAAANATVTAGEMAEITAPQVLLGAGAAGNKRVVVDGDPVVGGKVKALQNTHVFAL